MKDLSMIDANRFLILVYLMVFTSISFNIQAEKHSPAIFVVGDSHANEFSQTPHCKIHHISSCTMHRVGRDGLSIINLPAWGIEEGQVVIFAFGEIDARCHIGKQRDVFNRTTEEIIATLVQNYLNTILLNRLAFNELTCVVYSVTPPTDIVFNPQYPAYGSLIDRVEITKRLNHRLAQMCKEMGFHFLDVYNDYADAMGVLRVELSDGNVHINPEFSGPIIAKLSQLISKEQ